MATVAVPALGTFKVLRPSGCCCSCCCISKRPHMRSISICCACGSSRCSMETLAGSLACCTSSSAFAAFMAGRKAASRPSNALGGGIEDDDDIAANTAQGSKTRKSPIHSSRTVRPAARSRRAHANDRQCTSMMKQKSFQPPTNCFRERSARTRAPLRFAAACRHRQILPRPLQHACHRACA